MVSTLSDVDYHPHELIDSEEDKRWYSDHVDSEIESELYSFVHHIQNPEISPKNKIAMSSDDELISDKTAKNKSERVSKFPYARYCDPVTTKDKPFRFNKDKMCDEVEYVLSLSEVIKTNGQCSPPKETEAKSKFKNSVHNISSEDDELYAESSNDSSKHAFTTNISNGYRELKSSNKHLYESVKKSLSADYSFSEGLNPISVDEEDVPIQMQEFRSSSSRHLERSQNPVVDLWQIDREDKEMSRNKMKRTFTPISARSPFQQLSSGKSSDSLRCFLCGGNHTSTICSKVVCGSCFKFGHQQRNCSKKLRYMKCLLCNMRGHLKHHCPDLWRRYHLTTTPNSPLVKPVSSSTIGLTRQYCYNCGERGHLGFECRNSGYNRMPSSPFVIKYEEHTEDQPLKEHKKRKPHHNEYTQKSRKRNDRKQFEDAPSSSGNERRYNPQKMKQFNYNNEYDNEVNGPKYIWTGGKVRLVNLEEDGFFNRLDDK